MRLVVDIELAPEEVPLANELLQTLRTLTDHVRVRQSGGGNGAEPAALRPPAQLSVASFAALARLAVQDASDGLVSEVENQIGAVLASKGGTSQADAEALMQLAFFEHAFANPAFSPAPYVKAIAPFCSQATKMQLIRKVLEQLASKRPPEVAMSNEERPVIYAYACAFAQLAKLQFMQITGVATTLVKLLLDVNTRCAAVTMLGKMVELCCDELKSLPEKLYDELKRAVGMCTEQWFEYDVQYIRETMGWFPAPVLNGHNGHSVSPSSSSSAASMSGVSASVPTKKSLNFAGALQSTQHRELIYSCCYWEKSDLLVTGSKDGSIMVQSGAGAEVRSCQLQDNYAVSLDVFEGVGVLLACTAVDAARAPGGVGCPKLEVMNIGQRDTIMSISSIERRDLLILSAVKALPGQGCTGHVTTFVTAESKLEQLSVGKDVVCLYDLVAASGGGRGIQNLQPTHTMREHSDLITSLGVIPGTDTVVSAGRDGAAMVWDTRQPSSVGRLGNIPGHAGVMAHGKMITSVECMDHNVYTADMEGCVKQWDLRMNGQQGSAPLGECNVTDSAGNRTVVMKVAAMTSVPGAVAASTRFGLVVLDFTNPRAPVQQSVAPPGGQPTTYHAIKWAKERKCVFACGGNNIHSYSPTFS